MKLLCFGPFFRQYAAVIIVNFGIMNFGITVSWPSPMLPQLQNETNPVLGRPLTDSEASWVGSVTFIPAIITMLTVNTLVEKFGLKKCFIIAAVPRIIAYSLYVGVKQFWAIILGRCLGGMSDAITFPLVSVYASDIASTEIRGSLGTIMEMFSSIGILFSMSIGPFVDFNTFNTIILVIIIADVLPLMILPDSPYYLYRKGKKEEARKALIWLRGSENEAEMILKEYNEKPTQETAKFLVLLKDKIFRKSFFLAIVLSGWTQLCGYNALTFYIQTILVSTNTRISSEIASVIIGAVQPMSSIVSVMMVDKYGRKPLFVTGLLGYMVGLIGLGTFFYYLNANVEIKGFLTVLPLLSLMVAIISFCIGINSIVWFLIAELFTSIGRPIGSISGVLFSNIVMFVVTKYFSYLNSVIGAASTYWLFGFIALLLAVYVYLFIPETKNRSFDEIQRLLKDKTVYGFKYRSTE